MYSNAPLVVGKVGMAAKKKTEQKPSIKSVLSRAEFERLEVENFCRNLHIAQVVLFR